MNSFSGLAITQEGTENCSYLANLLYKELKGRPTRCIVDIYIHCGHMESGLPSYSSYVIM